MTVVHAKVLFLTPARRVLPTRENRLGNNPRRGRAWTLLISVCVLPRETADR
jgi:hypothetical protein